MKTKLDKARAIVCILHRMAKLPDDPVTNRIVMRMARARNDRLDRQLTLARAAYESAPSAYPFNPFA